MKLKGCDSYYKSKILINPRLYIIYNIPTCGYRFIVIIIYHY